LQTAKKPANAGLLGLCHLGHMKVRFRLMAELGGEVPNPLWDDVFKELERMEAILRSVPDLDGDGFWEEPSDEPPPPDLTPDM
jgi:hypothetical protein